MKTCTQCGVEKPLQDFYKNAKKTDGHRSECKVCSEKKKKPYKKCPTVAREERLRSKYGVTLFAYDLMLRLQRGGCKICGATAKESGRVLVVDHNHDTGEVRGLLCAHCNSGIGLLKDSPALLRRAIDYLEERGSYGRD